LQNFKYNSQLKNKTMQLLVTLQDPAEPSLFAANQLIYMIVAILLIVTSIVMIAKTRGSH
jgi:hypothetical protein